MSVNVLVVCLAHRLGGTCLLHKGGGEGEEARKRLGNRKELDMDEKKEKTTAYPTRENRTEREKKVQSSRVNFQRKVQKKF